MFQRVYRGIRLFRNISANRLVAFLPHHHFSLSTHPHSEMKLGVVVDCLNKFAPPYLAGSWDNVGLLVEPSHPHKVTRLLLTNDLTEPVLDEALREKVDMILSYHPPIFVPMKRLTQSSWKERVVVKCLEHRVAVFSPHTTYDAVMDGVNDWLIQPFGKKPSQNLEFMKLKKKINITLMHTLLSGDR